MNYNASNLYSKFYNTPNGKRLWEFLTRPDNIKLMKGAVYLNKVAVEILTPWLLEEFDREYFTNEIKQMCGNMVRQILENEGYQHKRYDIPCPKNELFTAGSKYKKVA